MKLLFFASDYSIGLSSLLVQQAVSLKESGIDFLCVAGEREQEAGLYKKIEDTQQSIVRINGLDDHHEFIRLARCLNEVIKKEEIRIVHVQNNWQLMLVVYVKYILRSKLKIVYSIHGFRHNKQIKQIIARLIIGGILLLFANRIICTSNYVKKIFGLLSFKMTKLYLGVDDSFFHIKEHTDNNHLSIIFPAQFRKGKGQDILIKGFAKYVEKTGDVHSILCLPGQGDLLDKCKSLSASLGVEKQVVFPGLLSKSEVLSSYAKSNIAAISSNSETFGQCIVEPFVLGKCIITRHVGVADEIIQEGVNGFFFNTEGDFEQVLLSLYNNKKKIEEMGQNNFEKRDLFSWATINDSYIKLINSLI